MAGSDPGGPEHGTCVVPSGDRRPRILLPVPSLPLAAGEAPPYLLGIAVMVVAGAVVAYLGYRVKLVPIVGFLLTGVLIGPNALGLVSDLDTVNAAADVGVLLLLFTIGLEFSLDRLKEIRRPLFLGGGLQVALATASTTAILVAAGVAVEAAVFTGFLVSLSSTAIVLKLLSDRAELSTPPGAVSVALLLFQDLAIVLMVLLVPALGDEGGSPADLVVALVTAVAVVAGVILVARRVLPKLLETVARTCSPEIFLLTVIAICFGTAYVTSLAGVSVSLGAFLAGLMVSESRFNQQALGEVLPLQIIFSATFFVSIGMLLDLSFVGDHALVVIGVVLAVLVVKALTTGAAVRALGQPVAVALVAALLLAQVGEFSFVLARSGAEVGLSPAGLGADGTQAFVAATVLLMALTPSLTAMAGRVGARMEPEATAPELAGRTEPVPGAPPAAGLDDHVIVAGYGRWARGITRALQAADVPQVVVTLSPDGAAEAHEQDLPVLLGDPARMRTLEEAGLFRARAVVLPDDDPERAERIARLVRSLRDDVVVVVRTRYAADVDGLRAAGADHVVAEEVEASAGLAMGVLRNFGVDWGDVRARVGELRDFQVRDAGDRAAAPRVLPAQRAVVDTEHAVEVALDEALCPHTGQARPVVPRTAGCEECLEAGDAWVHLRLCLTCGHVGCCDSSPNRHARGHHEHASHDLVRSAEPGEQWVYCFADDRVLAD